MPAYRFSHILLQKSSQKLNSCGEGEKCNQFDPSPFLDAWIGKRTCLFFSCYWPTNTPSPSPFAVVRAVLSPSRNCWGKGQRAMTVICGKGGYKKKKEITNVSGVYKGNHYTASRKSSLALGCVVFLSVWVVLCRAGWGGRNALEAAGRMRQGT